MGAKNEKKKNTNAMDEHGRQVGLGIRERDLS